MAISICVYCSSSNHVDAAYFTTARDLGERLGRRGDTLIWGGGTTGLMGELARAAAGHGSKLVGVIPQALREIELAYEGAEELIVTQTMRERKQAMDDRADAFIVLPGGLGTLEELTEVLVARLLHFHDRPIVLVNDGGFYDPLIALLDHYVVGRFARREHVDLVRVVSTPAEALATIDALLVA